MSGFQYPDNRNGYHPAQDLPPYFAQMNYAQSIGFISHPTQQAYTSPMYQNFPQPAQPQLNTDVYFPDYQQTMVPPPIHQAPPHTVPNAGSSRKGLVIRDGKTREVVDLESIARHLTHNNEKTETHEPVKSQGLKVHTPPPKTVTPDVPVQFAEESVPIDKIIAPLNESGVVLAVEKDTESSVSKDSAESEPEDLAQSSVEDTETDVEQVEEEVEVDDDTSDEVPQSSDEESVQSSGAERVRKYDRDQLIAIRSSSDFTSLFPINIPSVVSLQGGSSSRRPRDHRQQNKRVLNFGAADVKLDDVENAYKPAYLKQGGDESVDRTVQLTKDLNILLNRTLEDNIPEIVDEVKKLSLKDSQEIACLVKVLTTKATRQSKYSEVFAKLCVRLNTVKQLDGFKSLLLKSVNELFKTPLQAHIDILNAQIDEKIKETSDEKVRKMLEEDRETSISKKREAFMGIMQFFSHLYINKIIPERSVTDALKPYSRPKTQDETLALLACLNTCGQVMEQRCLSVFKDCMDGVKLAKKDVKLEQYVQYKITAFIELKERGWKKQEAFVPPAPPQILPRSNSSGINLAKRAHAHNLGKFGDSQTRINTGSLAVNNQGKSSSYLGPRNDWTKGSNIHLRQPKSDTASESENGKQSRASSVSGSHQVAVVKVDKNLTATEAIRDAIDAFKNMETPDFELALRESEKITFVKDLICKAIEERTEVRKLIVKILTSLYDSKQLSDNQMELGFNQSADSYDDLIDDCPKFGEFFGELMSCLLTRSTTSLERIYRLLEKLPSDKEKCDGLAVCLKTASNTVGEAAVAGIFQKAVNSKSPWNIRSTFKNSDFVKRYHLEFLSTPAPQGVTSGDESTQQPTSQSVKIEEFIKNKQYESLVSLCTDLKEASVIEKSLNTIFGCLQNANQKAIEALTPAVKVLVDSHPDAEKNLLIWIQKSTDTTMFKMWLQALLQKKVVAVQTIQSYAMNCVGSSPYQHMAKKMLGNWRH